MREKELQLVKQIFLLTMKELWGRTEEKVPEEIEQKLTSQEMFLQLAALSERTAKYLEQNEKEEEGQNNSCLKSIFNYLNGNAEDKVWSAGTTISMADVCYPEVEREKWTTQDYHKIQHIIVKELQNYQENMTYMNVLLDVLETQLFYVPSSCGNQEISLYEHMVMTMAIGGCLLHSLDEEAGAELSFERVIGEKRLLLFSMDISGIQDLIYTISSQGALKSLRARSFYLEIIMEHLVDELLEDLGLSRANLIYSGGGHCYMLFPGNSDTEKAVEERMGLVNDWFLKRFQTDLFVGYGMCRCSIQEFRNQPKDSYADIFRTVSRQISEKKMRRYSAEQIRALNRQDCAEGRRECSICKRQDGLDEENHCEICRNIIRFSKNILKQEYFAVVKIADKGGLPLPANSYLIPLDEEPDDTVLRVYRKNQPDTKWHCAKRIFVGDYTAAETLEELADESEGVPYLAIYRADVDNLGNAFVSGFLDKKTGENKATLSRTAALSKHLSVFFKYYINQIIKGKNAAIVYAGGDDLFILGAWNDVLQFAVDLQEQLKRYSQGTLTLSGGLGIYTSSYPVHAMAGEAAELEDTSKLQPGKNAVTLFSAGHSFSWDVLKNKVLGEKLKEIETYFSITENRGNSFLYHLLDLIREYGDKNNFVRYVYLLAKMEPDKSNGERGKVERAAYQRFSRKMYDWIQTAEDRKQLITAIYIYVYKNRKKVETV